MDLGEKVGNLDLGRKLGNLDFGGGILELRIWT